MINFLFINIVCAKILFYYFFLAAFTKKFGLTPEQFGENMRDNYQRHEVDQDTEDTTSVAEQFISR